MFAVSAPDKTFLGSNHDHEVCTLAWHDMIWSDSIVPLLNMVDINNLSAWVILISVPVDNLISSRLGWWFHTHLRSGWWMHFCSNVAPNGATTTNRYGVVQDREGLL